MAVDYAARPATGRGGSSAVETTAVGLKLKTEPDLDSWRTIGRRLCVVHKASAWWVGDWLVYGETRFGARYRDAMSITGLDYQTLRNYAWVASSIPLSRRRDELSFQHHAEVASLEASEQDMWLSFALQLRWSRNELRRRIAAERSKTADLAADSEITLRVSPERHARWLEAAQAADETLLAWIVRSLDAAAGGVAVG